MSNIIDKMYDDLKAKGYLSKDRDTFNKFFFAPGETGYQNRKKLYDDLHSKGYLQSSSYEDFAQRIGLHSVRPSQTASRQQDVAQQANKNAAAQAAADKSAPTKKRPWQPGHGAAKDTEGYQPTAWNSIVARQQQQYQSGRAPRMEEVLGQNFAKTKKARGQRFDRPKESYTYDTPVHEVGWDEGEPRVNKPHELSDRYENAFENPILRRTDEIENGGRQYERERNLATRERLATDAYESMLEGWDNAPSLEDWTRIMVDDSDEAKNMRKEIADAADKAGRTDAANLIRYIEDVNIPEALPQHGYSAEDIQGQMRYLDQERAIRSGFYRSQFDDIDDRIAHIDEMQDKLSKDASRHYNGGVAGAFAAPGVPNMGEVYGHYYGDPYLNAAKRSLEDAKSILDESDRHGNTSFVGGAFRGFGNKLFDVRTWDMGITEIGNGLHLKDVLEKADRGERLTPSEDELLKAKVTEMAVNAYFGSYLGRGYKAGQVTAQSLPFMLEMMINPLSAVGKSAQAMLTRYAIKKFGLKLTKEAGEGAAKKILQGGISETAKAVINKSLSGEARRIAAKALASRAGARIGGDVIGAASMTATTGQGHVVADLLNRTTGKVNFKTNDEGKVVYAGHDAPEESNILKAYAKSFGSQFIENHSEFMGDYFPYIGAIFSRGLDKIGGKYMVKGFSAFKNRSASAVMRLPFAPMAADFIRNASKSKWAKIIKGIQKRVHWNGPLNEYLEEVAGNIENAILVGDNDFSTEEGRGVFNLSDNIDTFLGVSLMSGAMLVSSAAGYRTPAYRARKMVENADARGEKLLGGSLWGKFKSSFDAAQSEQDKQVILTSLLQNSSLTNEGRRAVLQYASGKQFQQAVADGTFREMEEDAEKGNEVERACRAEYAEGQNIDNVEEMRDAKTRYNVLLREALAVEPNAEMYSDPQFYEQSNPNATPEQKAAMRAYAEAKAQYEGVADRMKTDMADQKQKANEQVERFKNQTDGLITRVRLRGSDAEFYVTSGHISLNNDGTINDAATSSNLTIVDGEGNQRFISRGDVVDVLAQNTPEETLEQLNDIIMNEAKAKADLIDGKLSFRAGDTFTILNNEGQEQKVTIAQDPSTMAMSAVIEGEQAAVPLTEDSMAKLQQMSDAYQESRFGKYRQEQQDAVANAENEATQEESTPTSPTVSQEEASSPTGGRSYGYGESVSYVDGEGHTQEGVVHGKTPDGTYEVEFDNPPSGKNVVDEYTQEELDALVQPSSAEQTEEVVPEQAPEEEPAEPQGNDAADSVPPTTEELVEMARGGNELAQYQLDQQGIQWREPAEQTKDNAAPQKETPTTSEDKGESTAEQTKDNAVAQSPKKDVPRDKDGNIIYDQVPVATTIEDLYDGALDDEEIGNFVQSHIDAANKAVDKITKKKPQISTNKSAYLEAKKKWEGELREAERKAQYWNDVKAEVEKITTPADARGWKDELSGEAARRQYRENSGNDHEAKSASEVAAEFFSQGHVKVTPESYRKETGFGLDEQRKMVGKISKEGKTIDRLSEELALFDEEYYNGRFFGGDSMVAKDALIAHLSSADARKGVSKVQSEAEAQFVEDYEEQRERYYQERYHMSYEEYIEYSAQEMPELMRKYSNFDEQQFYNRYADEIEADLTRREQQSNNNNGTEENDSTREEQRHDRGNQVQSGQRTDDNSGSEGGEDSEGAVRTRDEGSDEQKSSSEESAVGGQREQETDIEQVEGANEVDKSSHKTDNQGNPLNADGTLKLEKVKSVDDLTDEDFSKPTRSVELPQVPENVDNALGADGKPVIIKKNIFEKNWEAHKFPFAESRSILKSALYNTDLVGQTQPTKRPLHWVAIKLDEKSPIVVLEVNENKDNVEIVGWYTLDGRNLERIKRQAEKNGGELVMLSPKDKVESLSTPQSDLSSDGKGKEKVSSKQGSVGRKNVYGKNKVADWRTSVSSAMRQYETSPHDAHVAMCDIIDGMDSNALYGLMRMVLRTITSLDNENIRDGWKVDATHDLFDILKDRGFVVTKGSKGVAIGDVVIDKHGIIYVVEGVGKSRLDCGLYDVNDKTIIDHMTISRASVKYYYRDVNGKKDSVRLQKADVVDAELMAEEKPFNAVIEMLRKKFPDASMEALTAADRLLREQALPGERQKAIEAVAKALGLKVEWRDTMEKENGTFNPKTRTITIARDSQHALADTFGHEVTHAVRNLSEADYKNLKDAVRRLYSSEKEYNEAVQAYGDMYTGLDFDALEEELIADNIGFMIGGRNDMTQELASRMNHRVLWAIHDAMNKVRNALAKVLHIDSKKNGLLEAIDSARATIRETMANAQRIAKEKGQGLSNESGSARQSLRTQDTVSEIAEQYGLDEAYVAMYAEGMRKGSTTQAARALALIGQKIVMQHESEIHSLRDIRKFRRPIEKALKEQYGDVDKLTEEYRQRVMDERNAMEAARKKAQEEEAKRKAHLEELSLLSDDEIDRRYMEALDSGNEVLAREMLDEAARRKGYADETSDYQGEGAWSAPSNPGYESDEARRADSENNPTVNLEDVSLGYSPQPSDYFTHPERYGQDTPHGRESAEAVNRAIESLQHGKKGVKVKVYRAVPVSVKEGKLRNGDWVTPSKKYAEMHGEHRLEGKYRIIEDEVPVNELWWDANDANEWGYDNGKGYKYKNVKNNRKSDDLVTRDDKGNVIPPSKRFNQRKADERYQKRTDGVKPSKAEVALRDALVEHMRLSFKDMIADEEGQRVLDMANGRDTRFEAAHHKSEAARRRDEMLRAIDQAKAFISGKTEQQTRAERRERERKFREEAKVLYDRVLAGNFDSVTLQLLDDFINKVTPNNYYGRPLSKRLSERTLRKVHERERTSSVDALFSRISESAVPADERTRPEAKRRIEEKKKELLKGWAIATGNWHTAVSDFTDDTKPIGSGKDSVVYHSKDGKSVIKVSKGKESARKFRPDMDNVALFNTVFPASKYEIIGYGEIDGKFVRFLRQPIVDFTDSTPLSVEERVAYMERLGFRPMNDEKTAFTNGEIVASDIQGNNIVKDRDGNIRVIDADMRFHTKEFGGKYSYPAVETDTETAPNIREQRVYYGNGANGVRFFRTANGEAYGFTVGGKIYIDPRIATAETPIHEYAHLWATALKSANAKEWQNVVGLMKGTKVWDEVKALYPELKSEDEIADEVLATYSGRRGAERLREEQRKIAKGNGSVFEKAEAISALERVKQALKRFWKGVADFLHIHYTSAEEVADRVMKDLLDGVDPRKFGDGGKSLDAYNKIRKHFIGEQGAERADHAEEVTTRIDNLNVAREMEDAKKDAKAIKMATGWERGADGKWRYEIPDLKYFSNGYAGWKKARARQPWIQELDALSDKLFEGEDLSDSEMARFDELAAKESAFKAEFLNREKPHLADWVENDELFKAYPDLKRVNVVFTDQLPTNVGGSYNEREHTIVVNTNYVGDIDSVLAHEVQHAIQKIEGFARGGNPESIQERFKAAKKEWRARAWADELRYKADEMGEHYNQAAVEKALIDEYKEMGMDNEEWMPDKETRMKGFNYFARGYADRSMDADIKNFRLAESTRADFSPYMEYTKLGGEVESRNVEKRMKMSPEERRASLAAETEDVSREDQIFLFGEGGTSMKTSSDLNEMFGNRWLDEQTNDDGRHTTQVKSTINSYKKFGDWVKRDSNGRDVDVLDASSGLGLGTAWMRDNGFKVDDVEPFPSDSREAPTFSSYDEIDKKYDYIISNAVLNVIPDDWRANVLHQMADKLKDGGKLVINVRGAESISKQGKEGETRITLDSPSEILVLRPNGSIKAYQKGFTKSELKEWCEKELGEGYSVEIANNKNAGGSYDTAVVVTKNNESGTVGVASGDSHPSWSAQALPNSVAKLNKSPKLTKDLDVLLNKISLKGMGAHEFLFNVAKAFGLKGDNFNKSFYTDLGDSVGIRISDHTASTSNVVEKNKNNEVYGFVVKLSPHRFKSREDANYLEYVYYPDKLTQERQQEIVGGLKKFLETGDYAQLPSPDHVNRSGVFDRKNDIDLESSDVKQSRRGTPNLYPDHIAQAIYEQSVNGFKFDLDEAWHDSLLSVKRLQEAISETRGVPIRDFENVYWHAVTLSSVNAAEMEQLMNLRIQPFIEAVQDICKKHDLTQEDIEVYLNCKHGLERNEAMARKFAKTKAEEEFKAELKKAQKTATANPNDQAAQLALLDVQLRMNDRENELYLKNRKKDYSGLTDIFDPKDKVTGDRLDLTVSELEDKAKKCVDDFENKVGVVDVTKLWDNIHELNNYSLRKSYLSGLISKSQYDSVKQMYQWYVPLRGFNEEVAGDVYTYVTRGETRTQQLLKEAKGRTSRAGDILATMMNMANSAVNQGNRNLMKQKILNLALNAKSPLLSVSSTWYQTDANGFDVPIEPPINDQMTPSEQKDAIEQWEDTMKMQAKQGKVHRMSDNLRLNLRTQKWQADEHCIRVQRGGKEYCVWVNGNPRAAQALNDRLGNQVTKPYKATETILDKAEDLFTDGFIKIFRYMAQSVTSLNPEFVISNFQRDLASASLVSTGKYGVGYTKDFLVNVKRLGVLTGTMSHKKEYRNAAGIYTLYNKYKSRTLDNNNEMERYFAEFMANGGETGYTQSLSIKDYQSRIQSALGDKGFVKWSKNAGHAVADFVEMANRGVENTCRFAAYMTSRQHGKSVLQAIVDAKEASTNFNLHGAGGFGNAWLRKSIIFINPAVQSIVQYCQLTAKHPKAMLSMLGGTILLGAAMAFACASMVAPGGGDPDSNYWDLSDYVRHNYIVIPSGNGNWTRIALPPEIRAVYGLGVIAMEAAMGRMNHSSIPAAIGDQLMQFSPVAFLDPRNFFNRSDSDHSVGKTLIKAFTPTLASPIADAYIWDEDFMGRQITGKNDFNDDKPEFQRVSYDTLPLLVSFSRWLNNISGGNDYKKGWVNINPSAAGYVASQYIGGPLQFVTKIGKTVAMITYEDLRDMRNVPFLSRFMTSTDNDYGRNQVSNAEFKYWSAIADDVRTQIRGFEKEIESGDTKNLDDYKRLVSSKEYEMYQMIDYMDWLKDIRELNQKRKEETTQDAQKQVTLEIYEVRRKMAECLNKAEEMGVYLEMSQLNLELANAKTTEERAAIQAKINEKRKENLKKIGAIE